MLLEVSRKRAERAAAEEAARREADAMPAWKKRLPPKRRPNADEIPDEVALQRAREEAVRCMNDNKGPVVWILPLFLLIPNLPQ